MCDLTNESFGEIISAGANKAQNKSLLAKMNMLKKQILTRKYGDKIPSEFELSDSEEEDAQDAADQPTSNAEALDYIKRLNSDEPTD